MLKSPRRRGRVLRRASRILASALVLLLGTVYVSKTWSPGPSRPPCKIKPCFTTITLARDKCDQECETGWGCITMSRIGERGTTSCQAYINWDLRDVCFSEAISGRYDVEVSFDCGGGKLERFFYSFVFACPRGAADGSNQPITLRFQCY